MDNVCVFEGVAKVRFFCGDSQMRLVMILGQHLF